MEPGPQLTDRQRAVYEFIRDKIRHRGFGPTVREIGRHFHISTGTVKMHRKNIYGKLGISSQSELFSRFISYLSGALESDRNSEAGHGAASP